jgi:hypothetical protein
MAFIYDTTGVVSFADFSDVESRDQRIFDSNEGLTDEVVESHLIRATERILTKIRSSNWWRSYYLSKSNTTISTVADIPAIDINLIIDRTADFTDLTVYTALSEYTLPLIANFGDEETDERKKMAYYTMKADNLLRELIEAGDWYDFNDDGIISSSEKAPTQLNLKRIR